MPVNPILASAIEYLRLGWSVLLLDPQTKHPWYKWKIYQSELINEKPLVNLFKENPNAGVGIATGFLTGLVALDIDPRTGGRPDYWIDKYPTGLMAQSAGKYFDTRGNLLPYGRHQIYTIDRVLRAGETTIKKSSGVDVKAEGGVLVLPPSRRGEKVYEWVRRDEAAPFPPALIRPLQTYTPPEDFTNISALNSRTDRVASLLATYWNQGNRNTLTLGLTGLLVKGNTPEEEATAFLSSFLAQLERGGKKDDELDKRMKTLRDSYEAHREGIFLAGWQMLSDILSSEDHRTLKMLLTEPEFENLADPKPINPEPNEAHSESEPEPEPEPWRKYFHDITSLPKEKTEWIWQGYLAEKMITVFAATMKKGKSTLIFNLMGTLDSFFLGQPYTSCNFVILSEEPSATILEKAEAYGISPGRIFVRSRNDQGTCRLSFQENMHWAAEAAKANGAKIIVIDTWTKWTGQAEGQEQDSGATSSIYEVLHTAASQGFCILIIHHYKKAGARPVDPIERVRGSTNITAAADILMYMSEVEGGSNPNHRKIETDGRPRFAPPSIIADYVDGQYLLLGEVKKFTYNEELSLILDILPVKLHATQGLTVDEVKEKASTFSRTFSIRRVKVLLETLMENKKVIRDGGTGGKGAFRYYKVMQRCTVGDLDEREENA